MKENFYEIENFKIIIHNVAIPTNRSVRNSHRKWALWRSGGHSHKPSIERYNILISEHTNKNGIVPLVDLLLDNCAEKPYDVVRPILDERAQLSATQGDNKRREAYLHDNIINLLDIRHHYQQLLGNPVAENLMKVIVARGRFTGVSQFPSLYFRKTNLDSAFTHVLMPTVNQEGNRVYIPDMKIRLSENTEPVVLYDVQKRNVVIDNNTAPQNKLLHETMHWGDCISNPREFTEINPSHFAARLHNALLPENRSITENLLDLFDSQIEMWGIFGFLLASNGKVYYDPLNENAWSARNGAQLRACYHYYSTSTPKAREAFEARKFMFDALESKAKFYSFYLRADVKALVYN
ncbi:MAG: hypothetical protein IJ599_00595 [Alphaproteobacteria bacterium]|nr:hypothetical protein [Alphaproteobacteria bacterium]